jgi:hypothetical protein
MHLHPKRISESCKFQKSWSFEFFALKKKIDKKAFFLVNFTTQPSESYLLALPEVYCVAIAIGVVRSRIMQISDWEPSRV